MLWTFLRLPQGRAGFERGAMISLKKYLDQTSVKAEESEEPGARSLAAAAVRAYRSVLREIGSCSVEACPKVGAELKRELDKVEDGLSEHSTEEKLATAELTVQSQIREWVGRTFRHNQQRASEVKDMLMVMARTAESVGQRDQRAAGQFAEVTNRLRKIATLDDLSQMRASIEESAGELRLSVERMASEGKTAIQQLKAEVSCYQAKLEEAEQIAASDSLTGLKSRMWMENYIERRMCSAQPFCLVIADIDEFKRVNDEHGHPVGDELLKQFSGELKSALRGGDIVARWGGDEFMIRLDCNLEVAMNQVARLKKWACGDYTLHGRSGPFKLNIDASIGLAERKPEEKLRDLLARADADMYAQKGAARAKR